MSNEDRIAELAMQATEQLMQANIAIDAGFNIYALYYAHIYTEPKNAVIRELNIVLANGKVLSLKVEVKDK